MPATILLVDADVSNRTDWEALLRNYGYKVFPVDSGRAALAECSDVRPDLILIEGPLPDISSSDFCRQVKSDPVTQITPIVMILPSADPSDRSRSLADGADDFWARPASRWEALNRVQSLLHLRTYIDRQAESVAFSLARSIDAKDPSTSGHSERVREYAGQLGASLGLSTDELAALRLASVVHDIGKIAVPDSILFKPGALTAAEMEVVRQHPIVGENICAPLKSFREALPIIRHHHERMDGSGYPDGLEGDRIPLVARITQIVDIYDALTTDRPYRKAMPPDMALSVLASEASRGWLDASIVRHFTEICRGAHFPIRKEGSMLVDYHA
jgi:putative two-component system response regulator